MPSEDQAWRALATASIAMIAAFSVVIAYLAVTRGWWHLFYLVPVALSARIIVPIWWMEVRR